MMSAEDTSSRLSLEDGGQDKGTGNESSTSDDTNANKKATKDDILRHDREKKEHESNEKESSTLSSEADDHDNEVKDKRNSNDKEHGTDVSQKEIDTDANSASEKDEVSKTDQQEAQTEQKNAEVSKKLKSKKKNQKSSRQEKREKEQQKKKKKEERDKEKAKAKQASGDGKAKKKKNDEKQKKKGGGEGEEGNVPAMNEDQNDEFKKQELNQLPKEMENNESANVKNDETAAAMPTTDTGIADSTSAVSKDKKLPRVELNRTEPTGEQQDDGSGTENKNRIPREEKSEKYVNSNIEQHDESCSANKDDKNDKPEKHGDRDSDSESNNITEKVQSSSGVDGEVQVQTDRRNVDGKEPEDWDAEIEDEDESILEKETAQDTAKNEMVNNSKGFETTTDQKQDAAEKGIMSKFYEGTKSFFGFPPKQNLPFAFYVGVQFPANVVHLHIWNQFYGTKAFPMQALDNSKVYWTLPFSCIPHHLRNCTFYYSVNTNFVIYNNGNEARRIGNPRSHYSVFRYPKPCQNDFNTGLFHFAQLVYGRLCKKELTLKESLQEYDHINFGCPDFPTEKRLYVADWIQKELDANQSSETAIFFAHVIQHFDNRLTQHSNINKPLLKHLLHDDSAMWLIGILLSESDKNILKQLVLNVELLVAVLLGNVKCGVSFEYAVGLCYSFGVDIIDHLSGNNNSNWTDNEEFLVKDELYTILRSLSDNDKKRLLGFMVKRAPSISFTWKLYNGVLDAFPSFTSSNIEMFKSRCTKLLKSRQAGALPRVLQKRSWESIPEDLKAYFVNAFLEALIDQIRRKKTLKKEEEDAVITFFTDETVLSNEKAKANFLTASMSPELHMVVVSVLQSPNSSKSWLETKEETRVEVYNSLIRQVFSQAKQENEKGKVHRVFDSLHGIFVALDVCPCPTAREVVEKKCWDFFGAVDLIDMAQEFETVKGFHSEVEDIYFVSLRRCIDRDVQRDQSHNNVVELLKIISAENKGKSDKLERITKEILSSLCDETKILRETTKIEKQDFLKVFKDVFINTRLWSALMDVMSWPQGQGYEETPQLEVLCQSVTMFEEALERKNIKIKDLRSLKSPPRRDLLEKMHTFFTDKKGRLGDLITSCSDEEGKMAGELEQLLYFLAFIKKITERIVVVTDIDDILQETSSKKKNYENMVLSDVLDEDFWSCAESLLEVKQRLRDLEEYKVFYNAAQTCLEDECSSFNNRNISSLSRVELEMPVFSLEEVVEVLTKDGISHLKDTCKVLFQDAGAMPVPEAERILSGVKDLKKELDFICTLFDDKIEDDAEEKLQRFLEFPTIYRNVKVLNKVLKSLRLSFEDDFVSEFSSKSLKDYDDLDELYGATENVAHIEEPLHGSYGEVIKELSESTELIKLLKETANDDVRHLIDAVEEHSDNTVAAKEVSDFIEIHKFLSPVLIAEPQDFFKVLTERLKALGQTAAIEIAARIKASGNNAHSLRNVYKNVANRGEMTKEIVSKALKRGKYKIITKGNKDQDKKTMYHESIKETWEYSLSYPDEDETDDHKEKKVQKCMNHDMEKLQDLKSRSLLIVNTEKKQQSNADESVDFQSFIKRIDLLNEIVVTGEELQRSGHPEYQNYWDDCKTLKEIDAICEELKDELQSWEETVRRARDSNFYLNFFHTKQLWILKKYFNGINSVEEEVLSLLRFVDSSITLKNLKAFQRECNSIPDGPYEEQFEEIASRLKELFGSGSYKGKVTEKDIKRRLSVVLLDKDSTKTASVVMQVFKDASPLPRKILFCHINSTWYEIDLFLRRCFQESSDIRSPYCLANVESLTTDLQFQLIDSIREFQHSSTTDYCLVLICRGGEHHHIVNQFRECTKNILGMTDVKLRRTFEELFPDVAMVTSDLPGLGKTELINERALENQKRITCFSINGPVSREKLVNRLLTLGIDEECLLHIDISEVDDPFLVDTFLFELIVLGMVSSGTKVFHIPTRFISIEVANTLHHSLRDSLTVTKCFHRVHENWRIENFMCSQEKESAVQIVCHYLKAYDDQTLEKDSLALKDLKQATPLSESECRELISKHSSGSGELSYTVIETFLNVLATQLRKFSASPFFRPENLKSALKDSSNVRVRLFEALKNVSTEFATRSVGACKEVQALALLSSQQKGKSATRMVNRVKGMVKWADENHLVVMFQEAFSVSALFRELSKVPEPVKALFESQNDPLKDLGDLGEQELKEKLKRILFADTRNKSEDFDSRSYVLTPDNILKMVLIIQRIRAGVPVIVMGETGCGKTSLVRYLASSCGVPLAVLNFHAGIYEKDIVKFTKKQVEKAHENYNRQVWVFFDEINTCDYLGLINDIICHRSLNGRELPPNLVFIAACNPYCLRPTDSIMTAGLTGKSLTDEYSNLVYRVKPLPETMMDYVWDYGSLDPKDERAYIERMVDELEVDDSESELVVDLLATSQAFIRKIEGNPYCVSLRDIRRCILLTQWFTKVIDDRPDLDVTRFTTKKMKDIYEEAKNYDVEDRSIVLALAHSYQCRIPSSDKRKEYQLKLESVYAKHDKIFSAANVDLIIRAEQEEYLARMELPEGTARNTALRENVFVILVCILNKIPVFVVGKPGCSKSLSMQVIRSNLRGKDSKDDFFKTLPQMLVVSYQGSESSTSEGILKVFEKAKKYKQHDKQNESIPVVLLDEVGLAEISKYNPLKVLHRLLEPEEQELPDVAVVGISNWALDAAKMNRAIHLSRPEPTYEDLKETGLSILEAQLDTLEVTSKEKVRQGLSEDMLDCLAKSYFEYQKSQIHENFHGLRDYYSLIKCLSRSLIATTESDEATSSTFRALQRNFGGLILKDKTIEDIYAEKSESLQSRGILETREEFPVTDLISDNLEDPSARHLMLITSGESALTIMDKTLSDLSKEKVIIYGSRFEEDISEDYSYRILSRIILHMERDCVLVLRDLESVYGSLYDMLNQNYVVVGKKKNCRVALGPYSNPMCQVHDGFRCIVLVDEDKVDYADPPFLNRFEKQLLRYSDVLTQDEQSVINKLKRWTKDFCRIEKTDFSERDVFLGFHDDTLASLVLLLRQRKIPINDLFQTCKKELMAIATPEGILRSLRTNLYKSDPLDVKALYDSYFFQTPVHQGLKGFITSCKPDVQTETESIVDNSSFKFFVMTHSSIHTDVAGCLQGSFTCQVEKLGAFKSEKQLSKHIQTFWTDSVKELLIFQCKPNLDGEHISLMKSMIEQNHEKYIKTCLQEGNCPTKSICIIVHLQKGDPPGSTKQWQFNFLTGWKQATIDSLEEPTVPISKLLGESVFSLMKTKTLSLRKIIADKLMWCFTRLKYPPDLSDQQSIDRQVTSLQSSKTMMKYLEKLVLRWIEKHHNKVEEGEFWSSSLRACDWQINVSCDKKALLGSLTGAMLRYIDQLVRRPLAKAIYLIVNRLTFESCQRALKNPKGKTSNERFLAELIQDEDLFNIDEVPDPQEPKCYVITQKNCSLNFPFSIIFFERIGILREKYLGEWRDRFEKEEISPEGEADDVVKQEFFQELCTDIKNVIPQLFSRNWLNDNLDQYIDDIFDYVSVQHSSELTRDDRIEVLKAACVEHLAEIPEPDVASLLTQVHFCLWKHGSAFLAILQLLSICQSIFVDESKNLSTSYVKRFRSIVRNAKKLELRPEYENEGENDEVDDSFGTDDKADDVDHQTKDLDEGKINEGEISNNEDEENENDEEDSDDSDNEDESEGDEDQDEHDEDEHDEELEDDDEDSGKDDEESAEESEEEEEEEEEDDDDEVDDSGDNSDEDDGAYEKPNKEEAEEESDKESNDNPATEPFLKSLFNALCKRLIPTQELILKLKGVQKWQTTANSFVSFVAKSDLEPTRLFYNLRVCSDFTNMVLSPSNFEKPFPLYHLGALSEREGEEGDLHNCFDSVLNIIEDIENPSRKANEFKISFLWRCLGTCESDEQLHSIFFKACSFSKKDALELASPLVRRIIFFAIIMEEDTPFMDILEDSADSSSCFPFLQLLEEELTSAVDEDNGAQDCYLATICLSGLEQITHQELDFSDSEVSSSSSSTMACLKTAMNVVKESRKNQDILKLLTAVSYVRNSLSSVAKLVLQDPLMLKQETEYSSLLKYLSVCLEVPRGKNTENPRKAACMLYFLRELRQELSFYELRRLCEESDMLPTLKQLTWSDETSKVPIQIFNDDKLKKEFDTALFKLLERGDANTMKSTCAKLASDAKRRKGFACSLIEGLYLTHSSQTDTVDTAVESILKFLPSNLSPVFKQLVLCLTGKEDFKGKELRISPDISLSSVRKATIVLHLLAILTAECSSTTNIDRPFFSYLLDPLKASGGYVLATADPSTTTSLEAIVILTCSCRTAFVRNDKQPTCPQCNKPCSMSSEMGTSLCVATEQDDVCVSDMTPSSSRLLRLLVNAALFAGISLDTFSKETLAEFLTLREEADPVQQCLTEIDHDLEVLKRLWGLNEEQVVSTIHLLIEETSSLLTKPMGGPQLSAQSRNEFHKNFSDKVNQFFKSQSEISKQNGVNSASLEAKIDEKDNTEDFDVKMRNSWLPRLFRFTKRKSLEDLCASYNKASDSEKGKHGLLGLFVEYMKVLPKIGHLYPLIKFSNMLENHFGRRISRKDSEKLVGDVIKGADSKQYKVLKNAMKEFIESWENVRCVIEVETREEVPHLTEMSPVSYFLVDQGFYGQYLQKAILALQRIQNNFQGKVLKLALEGSCPALDFLKKSESSSSMPVIHVQDVKRSELICFEWNDDILLYSYHDTEYGKGHEIHYDFGKIESELAGRYLIGKAYLSTAGGLREFPYRNELFHTCANVLNDISTRLPQEPISADQQDRLSVLKDKELKSVQDLLDHLEVIICWLSKTSYFAKEMVEMPLIDYVKRKLPSSNLLPKALFEDPHKEFKLCHVVSMYQKLEEFLADASAKTVPDKYRKRMSDEAHQKLEKVCGSTNEMEVVITTLRRFIFRYLLSDQEHQDPRDPQENAVKYLSDPSLWTLDAMTIRSNDDEVLASEFGENEPKSALQDFIDKFIPRSMLICEVYSVMSFYDNIVKETKQKQLQQQPSPRKPTRNKRKLAPKFKMSGFA